MPQHEVAIVGAGPAGSAAAALLASWGHRVVVLEKSVDAARRPLAESLPPSCAKLFSAIGALHAVDAAGFYRSTGNTVWWGADAPRSESFPAGTLGYQVERGAFDAVMRGHARAAGAALLDSTVRDVELLPGGARVVTAEGSEHSAPFVLDCSGRAGVVARARGWRVDIPGHPRTIALVGVFTRPAGWAGFDPSHTLVESYGDGWAWSVPLSPHLRYVTAMVDPERTALARGRPALDVYTAELRKARHLASAMNRASLTSGPWGCDASVYAARTCAEGPLLLVGDAASFIDPLSSFGVKKAMASAWLAAVAVHTALKDTAMTDPALAFFAARETEMAAALLDQTRRFFADGSQAHAHPFWTDRADGTELPRPHEPDVRALRGDERVLRAFAALKARPNLQLRAGRTLRVDRRPLVRGHEIVLDDRLFTPAVPEGLRYLRDVDVAGLLALAPAHDQVPALFESYNRRHAPVALPDFLGALAVMLAFGIVEDSGAIGG
jgi:flavin-dependent dehydrogenase